MFLLCTTTAWYFKLHTSAKILKICTRPPTVITLMYISSRKKISWQHRFSPFIPCPLLIIWTIFPQCSLFKLYAYTMWYTSAKMSNSDQAEVVGESWIETHSGHDHHGQSLTSHWLLRCFPLAPPGARRHCTVITAMFCPPITALPQPHAACITVKLTELW